MKMKLLLPALLVLLGSCTISNNLFSGNKTVREQYTKKEDDNPALKQWMEAGNQSLLSPYAIALPYSMHGQFGNERPRALALQFHAVQGQQVRFNLNKQTSTAFTIFSEVFSHAGTDAQQLLLSADTASGQFYINVPVTGTYTLRLQPQMAQAGAYQLSIAVAASLGFPVAGSKAYVSSIWGNDRDGGKRKHEGIDIVAAKGTPAIAAADGYVSSVKEGGLGGKTVSLRPAGAAFSLYYAHLDEQWVQQGQQVRKGDTLGLVGNTGNAAHTAAHLHFGIYTAGGAIDPLPFVNKQVLEPKTMAKADLNTSFKLKKPLVQAGIDTIGTNVLLKPMAYTGKQYLMELPNGKVLDIAPTMVKKA